MFYFLAVRSWVHSMERKIACIDIAGNQRADVSDIKSVTCLMNRKAMPIRSITFHKAPITDIHDADEPIQIEETLGETLWRMKPGESLREALERRGCQWKHKTPNNQAKTRGRSSSFHVGLNPFKKRESLQEFIKSQEDVNSNKKVDRTLSNEESLKAYFPNYASLLALDAEHTHTHTHSSDQNKQIPDVVIIESNNLVESEDVDNLKAATSEDLDDTDSEDTNSITDTDTATIQSLVERIGKAHSVTDHSLALLGPNTECSKGKVEGSSKTDNNEWERDSNAAAKAIHNFDFQRSTLEYSSANEYLQDRPAKLQLKSCLKVNTFEESLKCERWIRADECEANDVPPHAPRRRPTLTDSSNCSTMTTKDDYGAFYEEIFLTFEQQKQQHHHHQQNSLVTFGTVELRQYKQCLGNNPACSDGPPVELDWKYDTIGTFPLDHFENAREPLRVSSTSSLRLPRTYRQCLLLKQGYTVQDLAQAIRAKVKDQNRREQTIARLTLFQWKHQQK